MREDEVTKVSQADAATTDIATLSEQSAQQAPPVTIPVGTDSVIATAAKEAAQAEAVAAAAAVAAEEVEEENRVILLNAPEASRTKDISATQLPPEAETLVCLECGDPLSSGNHKLVNDKFLHPVASVTPL